MGAQCTVCHGGNTGQSPDSGALSDTDAFTIAYANGYGYPHNDTNANRNGDPNRDADADSNASGPGHSDGYGTGDADSACHRRASKQHPGGHRDAHHRQYCGRYKYHPDHQHQRTNGAPT